MGFPLLRNRLALLLLAAQLSAPVSADIYKFVDKQGKVHLSDRALGASYRRIIKTRKAWSPRSANLNSDRRQRYAPLIDRVANKFRLDSALITAVVAVESGFDTNAVSRAGAVGLMQLMPDTARRYRTRDRRDPLQNLHGGSWYLRDLLLQFNNLALALAAYNAGEGAVQRYENQIPPYPETRNYVAKVIKTYRRLRDG